MSHERPGDRPNADNRATRLLPMRRAQQRGATPACVAKSTGDRVPSMHQRTASTNETHASRPDARYPGEDTTQQAHCGLTIHPGRRTRAFTLIETLIASVIVTISALALYGCLIFNLKHISISREERRSTQILVEMTETLRLYYLGGSCMTPLFCHRPFRPHTIPSTLNVQASPTRVP